MGFTKIYQRIQTKAQNIEEYYREHGTWKTCIYALQRLGFSWKKRALVFFELELKNLIMAQNNDTNLEFSKMEEDDFETLEYMGKWLTKEQALTRLKEGHALFVVKEHKKIICHQWLEFHKADLPSFELLACIPSDTVYTSHLYTIPTYRNKGLASKLKAFTLEYLRELGYQKVFLVIDPHNFVSQKTSKKFGFEEYQTVLYQRLSFRGFPLLRYYYVRNVSNDQRKFFWRTQKAEQELCTIFSKNEPVDNPLKM